MAYWKRRHGWNCCWTFYGQVLTERQRSAVELYCGEDYSLSEIAQEEGISRQGVRDALVRAEKRADRDGGSLAAGFAVLRAKSGLRRVCVELESDGQYAYAQQIAQLIDRWEGQ